jgi:hypothetical protein
VDALLEMRIQLSQLNLVQLRFTADLVHAQQVVETTLLVTVCIWIDQQRIGYIRSRASVAKQNHRADAVHFTHIQRPAVGRAQFREFLLAASKIQYARNLTPNPGNFQTFFVNIRSPHPRGKNVRYTKRKNL